MNHTAEDIAIRCLLKHFYLNLFVLTALFLLTLFDIIELKTIIAINIMVEMYLILFIIISIPIVLKGFADKIKKLPKNIDRESAIYEYKKSSYLRLYFICFITLASCMIYAFSQNKNFMYITVILLVVLLFCKPSYLELIAITESEKVSETPGMSEISVNDVDQVDNNK